jgi:hypothetical protein
LIAPGVIAQERNLAGSKSIAGQVVEIEVLHLVGADFLLRALVLIAVGKRTRNGTGVYQSMLRI